jgi:hypothetical protein
MFESCRAHVVRSPNVAQGRRTPSAARLVGVLGDRTNLRVVAAIVLGAETAEDVATAAGLEDERVERALGHLRAAGLVTRDPLEVDVAVLHDAARRPAPQLPGASAEQVAVLRNFVDASGRLEELPARLGRRRQVLEYVAERFERGREYAEPEVNSVISELHDDYATVRRYLVDAGLLSRSGGVYRRP